MLLSLEGTHLYTAWHINLDYSALSVSQFSKVINLCYWPILRLARSTGCVQGIEVSGRTLEKIGRLDPAWIDEMGELTEEGLVEPLSSGYAQIIGPLVPSSINRENFSRGLEVFRETLSFTPRVAFVNEQCSSEGVLNLLAKVGFEAAIVEWENTWFANPELPEITGYSPQRLSTANGIGIIWNHSRFFQGLQRLVHNELPSGDYWKLFGNAKGSTIRSICFYGGDAEAFGFRPRRFRTEAPISADEWGIIEAVMRKTLEAGATWVSPSALLERLPATGTSVFNLEHQITTKKQGKYNALRWAVSGRNNYELNNLAYHNHIAELYGSNASNSIPKDIDLKIWRSDLRTHLHPDRWQSLLSEAPKLESTSSLRSTIEWPLQSELTRHTDETFVTIGNDRIEARVDPTRGFSIQSLRINCPCQKVLIGRVPFGFFPGPIPSPDWFTASFTFHEPGKSQVTDLTSTVGTSSCLIKTQSLYSVIENPLFRLSKKIEVVGESDQLLIAYRIEWRIPSRGLIRVGHLAFNPTSWDWENTLFHAANGGETRSSFGVKGRNANHSDPISLAVSARNCVGLTDGGFHVEDKIHRLDASVGPAHRGAVLLLDNTTYGDLQLFRTSFSLQEIDDTFKERNPKTTEFAFSIRASCLLT